MENWPADSCLLCKRRVHFMVSLLMVNFRLSKLVRLFLIAKIPKNCSQVQLKIQGLHQEGRLSGQIYGVFTGGNQLFGSSSPALFSYLPSHRDYQRCFMSAEGVCKTCTTSYVCRIKFTEINARLSKNNR